MLFIARIELLNMKFKNKLNLDFFLCVIFLIMLFLSLGNLYTILITNVIFQRNCYFQFADRTRYTKAN